MNIAILGATSQIAKDLIISFAKHDEHQCHLFSRSPSKVNIWLESVLAAKSFHSLSYADFDKGNYDAVINFVGVGDPARSKEMGSEIFEITYQYDQMALNYIQQHPACKYIFLSSGAVYGDVFEHPVNEDSVAQVPINHLGDTNWYAIAKLHAEARHRALSDVAIVDIRVFNYFSHTQDMSARFLITDIVRAIQNQTVLQTSSDNIVRDFLHPDDFYQLVTCILNAEPMNMAVDCYSKATVDKVTLLEVMQKEFDLEYKLFDTEIAVNATGNKSNYYSLNLASEQLNYDPTYSSMSCILSEVRHFLES